MAEIGPAGLGMLQAGYNLFGAGQQHRRQRELMDLQHQYQQQLNQQGHDLQFDMWNKTNYGAQVAHMKKAGLNPALMYAKGGPGGTTGSQTGGGASGGNAVQMHPMDMANIALIDAERKLKEAQTRNLDSGSDVNAQSILESIARIGNIDEDTKLKVEQKLKAISETKLNDEKRKMEERKNKYELTGSALLDGFRAIGLNPMTSEADMWIARGMVGAWLGKDYVKLLMELLPANQIGKFKGKLTQTGKNTVEW